MLLTIIIIIIINMNSRIFSIEKLGPSKIVNYFKKYIKPCLLVGMLIKTPPPS